MNQRWKERREFYRRPDEQIATRQYDVAPIDSDNVARAFVTQHHYSQSYPNARWRFGLYRGAELVGVAVFSVPVQTSVLTNTFPGSKDDSIDLGRFVLLDSVPGNGESWFLARCFEQLKATTDLRGVVSMSDPEPRELDGRIIHPGHVGTIYQAFNGVYLGKSGANTLHMLPTGAVFNRRAQQKVRAGEQGWRYSARLLEAAGAPECPTTNAARRAWLRRWLPQLTRTMRHRGNHRYAWKLQKHAVMLGTPQPYPKLHAG